MTKKKRLIPNSNVFIALTSNQEFWDKSKEIVLLGDWCLEDIDNINKYRVIPYPIKFDDISYLNFYSYNRKLYSKYLTLCTDILNKEHQTKHSERYWDIVAGSFIFRYIGVMYEKYLTIKTLLEHYEQFDCVTIDLSRHKTIIVDELHFMQLIQDENYNLELYSKILSFLQVDSKKINPKQFQNKNSNSKFKKNIKIFSEFVFNSIFNLKTSKKIVFIKNSYLDNKSLLKLAFFSKYKIKVKFQEGYSNKFSHKYNIKAREILQKSFIENDEFELFLKTVLPFDLPKSLIENYSYLDKLAQKKYPKTPPEIIFSANSWYNDELFKLWASRCIGKSKLLGMQHGGNYGVSRFMMDEVYERKITNYYLTWGWMENGSNNLIPFGSTKMLNYKESKLKSDDILFVMTTKPKYFCDLRFIPHEVISYFEDQEVFLKNISECLLIKFRVRLYPSKNQDKYINLWKEYNKNIKIDHQSEKFIDSLNNCKLYVTDHLMTTYLESFKMNIPTIIFLNKKFIVFNSPLL